MMVILCIDRIFKGLPYVTPFSISIPFEWSHCYVVSFIFFFFVPFLYSYVLIPLLPQSAIPHCYCLVRTHSCHCMHGGSRSVCMFCVVFHIIIPPLEMRLKSLSPIAYMYCLCLYDVHSRQPESDRIHGIIDTNSILFIQLTAKWY